MLRGFSGSKGGFRVQGAARKAVGIFGNFREMGGVLLYGGVGFRPRALDVGAFLGCVRFWGFGVRKPP